MVKYGHRNPSESRKPSSMPADCLELQLDFCADTVEWCPATGSKDLFAVGTYQVLPTSDESFTNRTGKLYLLKKESDKIKVHSEQQTQAVLDCRWVTVNEGTPDERCFLGHVDSKGCLSVNELVDSNFSFVSSADAVCQSPSEKEVLALSLDWSLPSMSKNPSPRAVVSYSSGQLGLFELSTTGTLIPLAKPVAAHSFEAWIAAFDQHNPNVVYSGGDDLAFNIWDIRSLSFLKVHSDFKRPAHGAGVTSCVSHPTDSNHMFTGSYDESIRMWDVRNVKAPVAVCETEIGGGVWRMKWEPGTSECHRLAVAGMYSGFHILSCNGLKLQRLHSDPQGKVNQSIAYGVSWQRLPANDEVANRGAPSYLSTCSFYDKTVRVWQCRV